LHIINFFQFISTVQVIHPVLYSRGSQMVGRDPKVGRGTRTSNIQFYESPEILTLEGGRDQIKFGN
jgi:hypothetical protein